MILEATNQDKTLYSDKTRFRSIAISCFILLCSFFSLVFFRTISIKIPALYIVTACTMYLIVLYKNSINKYEAGIFFFLFIQLLALTLEFDELSVHTFSVYLLSYRYGISSRGFIATIIDILSNGSFISKHFVWNFIFCATILLIFLISVYLGSVIKKSENSNIKSFALFLCLLCLTCFASPVAYFTSHNFGRPEVYALLFMLLLMAAIDKPYLKWVIPFFALFTMSIHIILVFFYIPFIFILLFYKLPDKKEYIVLFFATFAVVAASFILYLLFRKQTFMFSDASAFVEYLKTDFFDNRNIDYIKNFMHMIFFADMQDHLLGWQNRVIGESGGLLKFSGTVCVLINLPLVLLFAYFWIKCFLLEKQRYMKLFFILPVLLFIYHIPVFFLFYDFGRWTIMIILIQFMLIFYLIHTKNKTALLVAEKITPVIKKHWWIIIVFCLVMFFLEPVRTIGPSDRVRYIYNGFLDLLKITL